MAGRRTECLSAFGRKALLRSVRFGVSQFRAILAQRSNSSGNVWTVAKPSILLRESALLIVNKPAGMKILQSKCGQGEPSLEAWLGREISVNSFRICQTSAQLEDAGSGLICVALSPRILSAIEEMWRSRRICEVYSALVRGHVRLHDLIECHRRLCRPSEGSFAWRLAGTRREGHEAFTFVQGLQHGFYQEEPCSLIQLRPITSCPQQLRLHCVAIGHPIVGDGLHAEDRRLDWRYAQPLKPSRLMLHCQQLNIPFSTGNVAVTVANSFDEFLSPTQDVSVRHGEHSKLTVGLGGNTPMVQDCLLGDEVTALIDRHYKVSAWDEFAGGLSEHVMDDTEWDHPKELRPCYGPPYGPPKFDDRR